MLIRRFTTLLFRHGMIQKQIEAEQGAPRPDAIRLFRLKRLRLVLKRSMRKIAAAIEAQGRSAKRLVVIGGTDVSGGAR